MGERRKEDEEYARVVRDLAELNSELVTRQRELARTNATLTRISKEKEDLLSMVAHDLRTPLAVITTLSSLLTERTASALPDGDKEIVTVIRDSARAMQRLVEDLLDFSTIDAGSVRLRVSEFDLALAIREDIHRLRALCSPRGVTIETACSEVRVSGDREKLGQVISNLVVNAIKYSPEGGFVRIFSHEADGFVRVTVQDQGPGIPADEMGRLFSPFGRTSVPAFDERERSTGLGLAIARRIVEAHEGHIGAESVLGRGTLFFFTVPVAQ